jgi:shikimate kinase
MNIVLIGYRGAGKSAVGRMLAARTGGKFVDADDLVEKQCGASIRDIVQSKGWQHFRDLERGIIEEICREDQLIIAPGGGAVLDPANVRSWKKNGLVIWLQADGEVLEKRMNQDPRTPAGRPTLTGKGAMEEFQEVLAARIPYYAQAADVQVDTSALSLEDVVARVWSIVQERKRA